MGNIPKNKMTNLSRNNASSISSVCPSPLIATYDSNLWLNASKPCAMPCKDPIFHLGERDNLTSLIFWLAFAAFLSTLVTLWNCHGNWISSKKSRLSRTLFRYHLCLILMTLGWLLQFLSNKSDLACQLNNTIIYGLTIVGPAPCIASFFLTYYMNIVSTVWFVYYSYLSHDKIVKGKKPDDERIPQQVSLFAWSGPFIMLIIIAFAKQIDGNSLYGICSFGQRGAWWRLVFYNIPLTSFTLVGVLYFLVVLKTLYQDEKHPESTPKSARRKQSSQRIIVLISFVVLEVVATNFIWIYEYMTKDEWHRALFELIPCSPNISAEEDAQEFGQLVHSCTISNQPSMTPYWLEIIGIFGKSLAVVFLVSNKDNLTRKFKKIIIACLDDDDDDEFDDVKYKKNNLIARVNGPRGHNDVYDEDGKLAGYVSPGSSSGDLSCTSTHDNRERLRPTHPKATVEHHQQRTRRSNRNLQRNSSISTGISYDSNITCNEIAGMLGERSNSRQRIQARQSATNRMKHLIKMTFQEEISNMYKQQMAIQVAQMATPMHHMPQFPNLAHGPFSLNGSVAHGIPLDSLVPPLLPMPGPSALSGTARSVVPNINIEPQFTHFMADVSDKRDVLTNPLQTR